MAWWWGRKRREKPIADAVWSELIGSRPVLGRLDPERAASLKGMAEAFLGRKAIEGVRGLELEPEMEARVAAWACLPVLEIGLDWYDDWHTVFLCPSGYSDRRWRNEAGGLVTEWEEDLAGEVFELGPVALSWDDVLEAGWGRGYNVVVHEMAHKLDARNGALDGAPPLGRAENERWKAVFGAAWDAFLLEVDRGSRRPSRAGGHGKLSLDDYAAEAPEEFFAVLCENFFERPLGLRADWPELYACLADYFRQDPAAWI